MSEIIPVYVDRTSDRREVPKNFSGDRREAGTEAAEGLVKESSYSFGANLSETKALHENKRINLIPNVVGKFLPQGLWQVGKRGEPELPEVFSINSNFGKNFKSAINFKLEPKVRAASVLTAKVLWKNGGGKEADFDGMLKMASDENVKIGFVLGILKDPKNQAPETLVELEKWNHKMFIGEQEFRSGKRDPAVFASEQRMAYKHAVEQFGDEDAKKIWDAYEKGELDMDSGRAEEIMLAESTMSDDIGIVDVAEAIGVADKAVGSTGVNVSYSFLDGASIESPDGFSLPLKVGKGANGYSYYLQDSRSETGVVGPIKAQELAGKFDERYTDNFFTTKVSLLMNNNEEIAKIPDKVVVGVLYKLLGEGASRDFSFGKKQRAIMDTFAKVIVVEDGKYPTMYKKMMALAVSMQKESNVNYFVKNLANGVVKSVSEYISEGDAGGNVLD